MSIYIYKIGMQLMITDEIPTQRILLKIHIHYIYYEYFQSH